MSGVYAGVRTCGCVTAAMVDDKETTPADVARFARKMQRTGRRVEHLTKKQFQRRFKVVCECKPAQSAAHDQPKEE